MDTMIEQRWNDYLAAYGAVGSDERLRLLEESVIDAVVFTNPGGQGESRLGLIAHIEAFQRNLPGASFSADRIYKHDREFLAIWSMHKPGQGKVATGYNYVKLADDDRFAFMAGFF
jgi:hypothetical protein